MSGESDGHACDIRVTVEAALPEIGCEHNFGSVVFTAGESAAYGHGKLNHSEIVRCDGLAPDAFGLAAAADGSRDEFVEGGDAGERFCLIANVDVGRSRKAIAAFIAFVRGVQS